ncbi:somatostatin receptor type 2-like [Homarus americanus]|uniref:Somatostatin receptor type 4-like3 n=1 Tax=Homarus americanus TaxID=6706 RepID=A0A8J5JWH4_HOMAM|nr:somatostatin receptor type 2-like [Homarus americanus]XP_042228224.1 somatostatin receptor type 2-like [Homarus americanus]XP_042228225.1 somatostatin receptor type 2-like [Homarus americanus]KAG7165555.1 Somatostatin receptor type 4-like3 [Homarus americanus]UDW36579.1 allatostatin C receptor 2 [Homarus americanus]
MENDTLSEPEDTIPLNCSYLLYGDLYNRSDFLNESNCTLGLFTGGKNEMSIAAIVITQMFYAITCLVGLCGNTLVIYVVTRFSKMQTVTNLYILNLAIADELFVVGIPFLMTTSMLRYWPFGSIMCKLYMITTSLNQFTSSLFLTIMSADRYIAVCHPISSPRFRTPMISKLVSLTAWTLSALMIVPVFMYSNTLQDNGLDNCNIFWPESQGVRGEIAFIRYSFALAFGIPLTLIFIFYSLVLHKLKSVGPKSKSKEKKKSRQKVTRLVLTVITVYVICWLPYWVLQLTLILSTPKQGHSNFMVVLFMISSCLSYINSALNPILYAFLSDNFKKSFMKACTCAARMEVNNALRPENSMFPLRQRGTSAKSRMTRRDRESGEGTTSQCGLSKEPSTAVTTTNARPNLSNNSGSSGDELTVRNGRSPGPRLPDLIQ